MRSLIALLALHLSADPGTSVASAAFLYVRCLSNTQLRLVPRGPPACGTAQAKGTIELF